MLRSSLISNLLTTGDKQSVCRRRHWSRIPRRLLVSWRWDR